MSENFIELPDNYVGSRGFIVEFDTGFNFAGITTVIFIIEKPDGQNILRIVASGDFAQGPNSDLIYGRIIDGDLDQEGVYYFQTTVYNVTQLTVLFSNQLSMRVLSSSATVTEVLAT